MYSTYAHNEWTKFDNYYFLFIIGSGLHNRKFNKKTSIYFPKNKYGVLKFVNK